MAIQANRLAAAERPGGKLAAFSLHLRFSKMTKSTFSMALLSAAAALALTACGGGGDSPAATAAAPAPSPAPTAPGPTAAAPSPAPTTPSPTAQVTAQASDKYVGTWRSGCGESDVRQGSSTGAYVREKSTVAFTATGPAQLGFVLTSTFFAPADTTCSQPSIGTLTTNNNNNNNSLTIDGTTVISGRTLEKTTVTSSAALPGFAGGTGGITINGLNYPNSYNAAGTSKNVLLVTTTNIIAGNSGGAVDAGGYPTTFDINNPDVLTKQ